MTVLTDLKVFITDPHSCSYLDQQQATTLFIDPQMAVDQQLYSQLTQLGFRRSGDHIYRPHCQSCNACIATRVCVDGFSRKRKHQKIWNKNADLRVVECEDIDTDLHYALFENYIARRHSDGDMYPSDREQYRSFLCQGSSNARFYNFYQQERLISVAVSDLLDDGLSAIYTFFDPEFSHRSLGNYGILWQIELARSQGLSYLYLGYWIKECRKMNYKTDYRPLELYINQRWVNLN